MASRAPYVGLEELCSAYAGDPDSACHGKEGLATDYLQVNEMCFML